MSPLGETDDKIIPETPRVVGAQFQRLERLDARYEVHPGKERQR
jgi:hypothetical protein